MASNYTLTIKSINKVRFDAEVSVYSPDTERCTFRAKIFASDGNGKFYNFYADSVEMNVTGFPGGAVVTFNGKADFLNIPANYVIRSGETDTNEITPKFNIGNSIIIRATEKDGRLTRVKLVK